MVNQNDPRVKRTQRLIEQSFWTLMKSQGFEKVSIATVTKKAGINRATFYAHYADKQSVLAHIALRAFHGGLPEEVRDASDFSPQVCAALIEATSEFVFSFYDVCGFAGNSFAARIDYLVRADICDVVRSSMPAQPLTADVIGSALYGGIFGCYVRGESFDEAAATALADSVRGLLA
ncbi:MAG: TetR/AcrR family transcriptional regulator [Bifidobacteriaceae bacterium]|nr:TetR/AcrR family transcriptional regulator [Bifidobacteriaceae bacterium]MCI1914179.1 TetR/AcrR family transcriptional regulator [Bifidobacteriaceae bacterium]